MSLTVKGTSWAWLWSWSHFIEKLTYSLWSGKKRRWYHCEVCWVSALPVNGGLCASTFEVGGCLCTVLELQFALPSASSPAGKCRTQLFGAWDLVIVLRWETFIFLKKLDYTVWRKLYSLCVFKTEAKIFLYVQNDSLGWVIQIAIVSLEIVRV